MSLPAYSCHKVVHAAKIVSIGELTEGMTNLVLELPDGETQVQWGVNNAYMTKHIPQPGGYLVIYEDRYESWSPGPQFEEGYTLLEAAPEEGKT